MSQLAHNRFSEVLYLYMHTLLITTLKSSCWHHSSISAIVLLGGGLEQQGEEPREYAAAKLGPDKCCAVQGRPWAPS